MLYFADEKHTTPGSVLKFRYYGQECQLIVKKITDCNGDTSEICSSDLMQKAPTGGSTGPCDDSVVSITAAMHSVSLDTSAMEDNACSGPNSSISGDQSVSSPINRSHSYDLNLSQSLCSTPKRSLDELTNFKPLSSPIDNVDRQQSNFVNSGYQQKQFYKVSTAHTKIELSSYSDEQTSDRRSEPLTFARVGGLDAQIQILKQMVELPLKKPELFQTYGKFMHIFSL